MYVSSVAVVQTGGHRGFRQRPQVASPERSAHYHSDDDFDATVLNG